jgi:hypothetical protein
MRQAGPGMTIELRFQLPPQHVTQPICKLVIHHPIEPHLHSNLNGQDQHGGDIKRLERKESGKGKKGARENISKKYFSHRMVPIM